MRYRKKPTQIDAFQLGIDYLPDWFMNAVTANVVILHDNGCKGITADVKTLESTMHADNEDFIIHGIKRRAISV